MFDIVTVLLIVLLVLLIGGYIPVGGSSVLGTRPYIGGGLGLVLIILLIVLLVR